MMINNPILGLVFLLMSALCVFMTVTLFQVSSSTAERVLSIAWSLIALAFWFASGAILAVSGPIGNGLKGFQAVLGFFCVVGGCLGSISVVASLSGQPPLPVVATVAYALVAVMSVVLFQVFLSDKRENDSVPFSILALFLMSLSLIVLVGTAVQNVAFATRVDHEVHKPLINGTRLYINCVQNGTAMVVILGDIDHSSVYYMPLQQALSSLGLTVCVFDSAGVGFSESGSFPRSPSALAAEASHLLEYLLAEYTSIEELFVLGCGHGGKKKRKSFFFSFIYICFNQVW